MRNVISDLIQSTAIVLDSLINQRDEQSAQQGDI
jgi:hypothetical protein